jgi:spore maturation protein B
MKEFLQSVIAAVSVWAIPCLIAAMVLAAACKRVAVYEEFVEGAKEGFNTAVRIIPFLVAMLVAMGMFRASGAIDLIKFELGPVLGAVGFPSELLPMALMRPLSGTGSLGVFSELVTTHGPDSLLARTAGTMMGSSDTTFYILAVYFGSVAVRRARHAVAAALLGDLAGMLTAVWICRVVFEGA